MNGNPSIARMDVFVYRAPVDRPVVTSFGAMGDRPAVLLKLTASDGLVGWGEIWCNFPQVGAEHRARLAHSLLPPLLLGREVPQPSLVFQSLEERFHVLALQTGEHGPIAQMLAGLDIALWDMAARRLETPLRRLIDPDAGNRIPVYASGIHAEEAEELVPRARAQGFDRFKLKVGFGPERDAQAAKRAGTLLRDGERLMLDANQKWSIEEALEAAQLFAALDPIWLEEPMPVDTPAEDWAELAEASPIPLAGGENLTGFDGFGAALEAGYLKFLQPDVCKWGGVSGNAAIARAALQSGFTYCPHYLGGGIGLAASAQLLAAIGGPGLLEVDVNPNPLRALLGAPAPKVEGGYMILSDAPGLGVAPDLDAVQEFRVLHLTAG